MLRNITLIIPSFQPNFGSIIPYKSSDVTAFGLQICYLVCLPVFAKVFMRLFQMAVLQVPGTPIMNIL